MEDRFEDNETFNMDDIMARHESMEEELEREELERLKESICGKKTDTLNMREASDAGDVQDLSGSQAPSGGEYPREDWEAILEAVLFTMGSSVSIKQLAAAIGQDMKTAWLVVQELKKHYDEEKRGMQIIELEDSVQMCTRTRFYENLIRVAATPKKQVLTDVALETLSIIAYKQPVTKAEIEKIRGVKSDHAVNKLIEYNLVYEVGRMDAPGRPALFATTEEFLRRFGVGSVAELPELNPEQVEEFRLEAEEELQYTSEEKENQALKEAAAAKQP
ncbi:SMC-Scp complex subunit ScpB [Lachnospiraceae bacterium 62-35]